MTNLKLISLFLFFLALPLFSLSQSVQFELLSESQGLTNSKVIDFTQDNEGFLWVATLDGLNRYDGRNFILFSGDKNGNKFSDTPIEAMSFIENQGLWLFRENKMLTLLQLPKGKWTTQNEKDWQDSPTPPTLRLFEQNNGIWILLEEADNIQSFFQNEEELKKEVLGFLPLENGSFWWSGNDGQLYFFDKKKNFIFDYSLHLQKLFPNPTGITKFFKGKSNIIWGATDFGLLKIKPPKNIFDTYLSEGDPFCGINGGNCSMRGIAEDADGNIYFSHYNSIHVLKPSTEELRPLLSGHKNFNQPFDLVVFDKFLWTNSSKRVRLSDKSISTVLPSYKATDNDIGNYMFDKKGNLWLGRGEDLWIYNAQNQSFTASDLIKRQNIGEITYLLQGSDGDFFWLGTRENGLLKVDYKKGIVATFDPNNSGLKSNYARVMFEDQDKKLWIGTQGGLYAMDIKNNIFSRFTREDGLPHDIINSILPEGDSCLWIGTDLGLSRFHKKNKTFINFFVVDGLPDNELARISFHKAKNGRMYFGGLNGIIAFYPEQVMGNYRKQQSETKVLLTTFTKQDNRKESPVVEFWNTDRNEIDLYHYDKNYNFQFALSDYQEPENIFYSYKMEGIDPDWSVPSKINTARYNNLPPKDYIFKVKARDPKGGWNPKPLILGIHVHPPWWETKLAYLGYILFLLGLSYVVFRFFKNRLMLQSRLELQKKEAERLKELDTFKTKLYGNITHEFRTPLTVILGMSDQIEENLNSISDEKIKENLHLIKRNGNNLLHLVNQMLDLSKLESNSMQLKWVQGDAINYLRYITESFHSFASSQGINLSFKTAIEKLWMDYDEDKLLKIVSNLLSNAIKFTPENGKVQLNVDHHQERNLMILKVSDTGIGVPQSQIHRIFERFFQAESADRYPGWNWHRSIVDQRVGQIIWRNY